MYHKSLIQRAVAATRMCRSMPRGRVLALLLAWTAAYTVQAQDAASNEQVRARFLERLRRIDKMAITFSWSLHVCAPTIDVLDRSAWGEPKVHTIYSVRLCRPHFHFSTTKPDASTFIDESSWVDGMRIRKVGRPDGFVDVSLDKTRFSVTGPIPFLTPLEIFHSFDVQHSLAEMWEAGLLRLTGMEADRYFISGDVDLQQLTPGICSIEALIDAFSFVPEQLSVTLNTADGTIEWRQTAVETRMVNGAAMISEAIITLKNNVSFRDRTTLYHFKVLDVDLLPQLRKDDLRVQIPKRGLSLVDEVGLVARRIGLDGTVLHEEKWTPEQRAADLAGARETARLRHENLARLEWRKTAFMIVLLAAAGITAVAGVLWWKRQALMSRPRA